jgi:hypothetical protein
VRLLVAIASSWVALVVSGCSAGHAPGTSSAAASSGAGGSDPLGLPPGDCSWGECATEACASAIEARSSVGCDYYAVETDGGFAAENGCFVAFVANTSPLPAHVDVAFGEKHIDLSQYAKIPMGNGPSLVYGDFDPTVGVPPGQVAILFLSGAMTTDPAQQTSPWEPVRCPVPAAVPVGAQVKGTGVGAGFRIQTDVPIVAYQMLPYGGGQAAVTGATLLIPTSAWDTNYLAVNAYGDTKPEFNVGPSMNIVAALDDTSVTLLPKFSVAGGPGVANAAANTPVTFKLDKGQFVQITQGAELTGSPIQSDKPIGLWAGHQCTDTPKGIQYCDHAEQQIPAIRSLGSEYVGVTYRPRLGTAEAPPWRILGAAPGTKLTYEPATTGPTTLGAGELVEFSTGTPFVVRSQDQDHPFLLLSYMSGSTTIAKGPGTDGYGDPDVVRVVPAAQYLKRYVFFTDPTYPETNLVVVRKRGENGFANVWLDCSGDLDGWQAVGSQGVYEMTRVDLMRHDFEPQGSCSTGRREMTSTELFGVTVWGWGTTETTVLTRDVSYGYPAGEGLATLTDIVVPPVPK